LKNIKKNEKNTNLNHMKHISKYIENDSVQQFKIVNTKTMEKNMISMFLQRLDIQKNLIVVLIIYIYMQVVFDNEPNFTRKNGMHPNIKQKEMVIRKLDQKQIKNKVM